MEDVNTRILIFHPMRLDFDLNLRNERSDGLDGTRHSEEPRQGKTRIRQTCMNALTDGPDLELARKGCQDLNRTLRNHIVELAHQSLVRTEYDRPNDTRIGLAFSVLASPPSVRLRRKHTPNPSSTVR